MPLLHSTRPVLCPLCGRRANRSSCETAVRKWQHALQTGLRHIIRGSTKAFWVFKDIFQRLKRPSLIYGGGSGADRVAQQLALVNKRPKSAGTVDTSLGDGPSVDMALLHSKFQNRCSVAVACHSKFIKMKERHFTEVLGTSSSFKSLM